MRWHPGTLHCWRLHPWLLEGDRQHDDGSDDGDVDVATGESHSESLGNLNPILFQEATFASGGKNKAVRYL